jgi:acetyltransferase EpsM
MPKKVVIWGASGHALVVADVIRRRGEYEIVGFLDSVNSDRRGCVVSGLSVLGGCEEFPALKKGGVNFLVFGFGDCAARLRLASVVLEFGFQFATAIHPQAIVAPDAEIGAGTVVVGGAVVNSSAVIGRNSIINTSSSVDHECVLGEAVHISPGARLGGRVTVGEAAWIGIGATVLDRRKIGARSIIGAGSIVTRDIGEDIVAYGCPARPIRSVSAQMELREQRMLTR